MEINSDEIWLNYAKLQVDASNVSKLGPRAWAIEEKLDSYLECVENNTLPPEGFERDKKFINLEINRQKKYRHRESLLENWADRVLAEAYLADTVADILDREGEVSHVEELTSQREWRILWALANDRDIAMVACDENISLGALKTRVSRCRKRLRAFLTT